MPDQDKRPRGRRAHLRYFTPDANGGYTYTGPVATCQNPRPQRLRLAAALGAALAIQILCFVATGVVPVPGMDNTFYVLLPWLGELISLVLTASSGRLAVYLWMDGAQLRLYRYEATVQRLPVRTAAVAVFAALAALGEVVCLLRQGAGGNAAGAALFLGCQACIAAAALACRQTVQMLRFELPEK